MKRAPVTIHPPERHAEPAAVPPIDFRYFPIRNTVKSRDAD